MTINPIHAENIQKSIAHTLNCQTCQTLDKCFHPDSCTNRKTCKYCSIERGFCYTHYHAYIACCQIIRDGKYEISLKHYDTCPACQTNTCNHIDSPLGNSCSECKNNVCPEHKAARLKLREKKKIMDAEKEKEEQKQKERSKNDNKFAENIQVNDPRLKVVTSLSPPVSSRNPTVTRTAPQLDISTPSIITTANLNDQSKSIETAAQKRPRDDLTQDEPAPKMQNTEEAIIGYAVHNLEQVIRIFNTHEFSGNHINIATKFAGQLQFAIRNQKNYHSTILEKFKNREDIGRVNNISSDNLTINTDLSSPPRNTRIEEGNNPASKHDNIM